MQYSYIFVVFFPCSSVFIFFDASVCAMKCNEFNAYLPSLSLSLSFFR